MDQAYENSSNYNSPAMSVTTVVDGDGGTSVDINSGTSDDRVSRVVANVPFRNLEWVI